MILSLDNVTWYSCLLILGLTIGFCSCGGSSPSKHTPPPSNELYVAADGNDSNPGTLSQPFLTIQKCATKVASGGTCNVRAGTYHETVTPNSGVTITSYNGESVTVTGADPVTGWSLYQGSIYQASVSMASGSNQNQLFANQLFVGNQMVPEAQWPAPGLNNDMFNVNWETMKSGTTVPYDSNGQPTGNATLKDSSLPSGNWAGAGVHFWSGTDPYNHFTGTVASSSSGQLKVSINSTNSYGSLVVCPYMCPASGGYYYLFGALLALTEANQWYYNSSTGALYFWAPAGVNPSTLSVSAKQRLYCFDLSNSSSVTIENLNLFACSVNTSANSSNITLNGIKAQYVSHYTYIEGDGGSSESGIILQGSGGLLENSTIAYSAGNGVAVMSNGGNITVQNNLIHHTNYMTVDGPAGISVAEMGSTSGLITITNNTIYATGRSAIEGCTSQAGNGYIAVCNSPLYVEINYNNLYGAMMMSNDGGTIYICCGLTSNNSIDHNWIHDAQIYYPAVQPANTDPVSAVYLDNGTTGFSINQNVMWNNEYMTIDLSAPPIPGGPWNDSVTNNTVPDINSNSFINMEESNPTSCGTAEAENNQVLVAVLNQSPCPASNNSATAPGATQMISSVQVGCNFTGCSSEGPPAISGSSVGASVSIQPQNTTVNPGQTATFTVTAYGSPTLSYQWQKNGTNISGATSASYATPTTTTADNGEVFSVQVSNSIGSATSAPATLTVQ